MRLLVWLWLFLASALSAIEGRVLHEIEGFIADVAPTALIGIKVYSLDKGKVLYERNAKKRFTPASSLKLFTVAAALHHLGGDYRFETKVVSDEEGNCYLTGSGDPSLSALDLIELVEQLDLTLIQGDLILDLSCFEDGPMGPGWMWDEEPAFWSVPMSALNLEHNYVDDTPILEPAKFTGALFKSALQRKGVEVQGKIKEGKAPETCTLLAKHESEPLRELAKVLLKNSDNLYANCIFKKMGGSWTKGQESVESFLEELRIEGLRVVDGSGESRYNLISPHQMVKFLKKMKGSKDLREALPTPGEEGTLRFRMGMLKDIQAKTGSMTGVSSLCGYLTTEEGEKLTFAIFVNGYMEEGSEIKEQLEDRICHFLSKLPCSL